jgi:tetratricopeptide (TPR) repeat protein
VNDGYLEIKDAIKMLSYVICKNAERLLNALRLDEARPESIRKAAQKVYEKNYIKNKFGENLSKQQDPLIQGMIISEDALIPLPLPEEEKVKYEKAVQIILDPSSKKNDFKKAFIILEDFYNKNPDFPSIANNYASALSRLGKYEEAKKIIENCFAAHPEYVFGAANYLNILMSEKKIDEAKAMYDNYNLPNKIHPLAYLSWYNVATKYLALIGDKQSINQMKKLRNKIVKEFDL